MPLPPALSLLAAPPSLAKTASKPASDDKYLEPFPAHHVAGNIYFVGTLGQANYLITTPQGNILVNSGVIGDVPLIKASIAKLGFKYSDTKILLISHAHFDHDAASAQVVKETGAKYEVMDADVPVVESGGKTDFQYGDKGGVNLYPPVKVDHVLHDGDTVELGGTVLTAHKTPGHTKGCTTWTMQVKDGGKTLNVTIVGRCPNVNPGYVLVGNKKYPGIVQDYEKTFQVLKSHCPPTSSWARMATITACRRNTPSSSPARPIPLSIPPATRLISRIARLPFARTWPGKRRAPSPDVTTSGDWLSPQGG